MHSYSKVGLASGLLIVFLLGSTSLSVSTAASTSTSSISLTLANASGVRPICAPISNTDTAGEILPAPGGAFVEDWDTGSILFCGGGVPKTVARAPLGGAGEGYYGMGEVRTKTSGLVIALMSELLRGLWICKDATTSGCGRKSAFITLPSSFCPSATLCSPMGAALDMSLNLYYVDSITANFVECTSSSGYQSCSNLPSSSALKGYSPTGLFLHGSTFYIIESSCAGKVWKGTANSLSLIASFGDQLDSIAVSNRNPSGSPHLYVADSGSCTNTPSRIVDLTDGESLPTPFILPLPTGLYGLDSSLQFTYFGYPGAAWQTTDAS